MKRLSVYAILVALIATLATAGITVAAEHHAQARLHSVGGSSVTGFVNLEQHRQGTAIHVMAFGLTPEHRYVSLYYSNHTCALEPYSAEDVIGGRYQANRGGVGTTHGMADDDLDEINSVSVRDADNFQLLACADIPHRS